MPPLTPLRVLGVVIAAAWVIQLVSIATSTYLSAHTVNVPLNGWFFVGIHLLLAAAGIAAGVLAIRGTRSWKWWALVSGLAFLFLADLGWYSLRNSYSDMIVYLLHNPRIGFSVFLMPPLAMLATFVALWTVVRDAIGRPRSGI